MAWQIMEVKHNNRLESYRLFYTLEYMLKIRK